MSSQSWADRNLAEMKKRQLIRETNPELRQLESRLRLAYINKERAAQIEANKLKRLLEKRDREEEADRHAVDAECAAREEAEREREERMRRIRYQRQLDLQLVAKQGERDADYALFLKEKKIIDAVIAKVKAEQRKARMEAAAKKHVQREDIRRFREVQAALEKIERERNKRENERIEEFVERKEAWTKEQEEAERERRRFKHDAVVRMAEDMRAAKEEEIEREEIMFELRDGRRRDEERRREAEAVERELRKKLELKESNEAAAEYRKRVKERQREEEEQWRLQWVREMEEKERLEQMSDARRRRRKIELRRESERMSEQRRMKKEAEANAEREFWAEQREREAEMDRVIEEERVRLLRVHANRLVGHLPRGIVREENLDYLDEEVRKAFQKRPYKDPIEFLEEQYAKQ